MKNFYCAVLLDEPDNIFLPDVKPAIQILKTRSLRKILPYDLNKLTDGFILSFWF